MRKFIILSSIVFFSLTICLFFLFQNAKIYNNTLGLVSKNWVNEDGNRSLKKVPYKELSNDNYIQWDGAHYNLISKDWYNIEKAGGDYIFAFFPLFPLVWKVSGLNNIGVIFLNFIFFVISLLILQKIFDIELKQKKKIILILLGLPSAAIFLIPYSEALFLLVMSIGFYGLVKGKKMIFFIGFYLAALTRPSFTILLASIICVEIFYLIQDRNFKRFFISGFLKILPLLLGTLTVSLIQKLSGSNSFFTFIEVQKYWDNVLVQPKGFKDWSHEGYGINIGVIFLIFIPLVVMLMRMVYRYLLHRRGGDKMIFENTPINYLQLLSLSFVVGSSLFIFLFRGGSLHCLFRFTICTPFFFFLVFNSFSYIKNVDLSFRKFVYVLLFLVGLFVLVFTEYSGGINYSDLGFFLFSVVILFWLLLDSKSKFYNRFLYSLIVINMIWTSYLFNMFISNGWIYA
ncbi:MAG: hypothetical protein ACEPOV_03745 [Hyphomicrobiales bacterium]